MTSIMSDAMLNAGADAMEAAVGASPTIEIYTGARPATLATAPTGTLLATAVMPADWATAAAGGLKTLNAVTLPITVSGDAGYFLIKQGATRHWYGTVSRGAAYGGTGDLKMNRANESLVAGDSITVSGGSFGVGQPV
ncbi:hypothetical protein [Fuscibacter oryzae]|uniref:Uncharacterized protein n=1 Tax=Fuscibacter oryzae TaxID=2803939 RepID=A0A8J7MS61_9RHOB|nr:hypothetical protein [Fuscibacter oryzae]MBL4929343.1 hypothetical protein [Fuscibacter oryzae]